MLPEIELLNISKDIQVDNKDIFGDAVVDWLFDVDHTHRFKTKYSSPSAESSIASASTSNNVVKEDNASQASLSKRTSFKTSFRSICSDEVHQVEWGNDGRAVEQEEKGHEDELLPSLRATKEPLRCQWSIKKKKKRCGRSFNTAEALTRHVLGEHAEDAQQAGDSGDRSCHWGICKAKASDLQKHIMGEHLAVHAFACPFEKCRSVEGPPKSFEVLQSHVRKYHSEKDRIRPLFMPLYATISGPNQLEKLPKPFPFYKVDQPTIHSQRRKASTTIDNRQTAITQLTPSFSQEARRPAAQPWKEKEYTRIQDGVRLTDAYALDDGRNVGMHDTWEVSLASVVTQITSTPAVSRPRKQHRPDYRGRR